MIETGIRGAVPFRVEPDGRVGARGRLITLGDEVALSLGPGAQLHRAHRIAAADLDPEQVPHQVSPGLRPRGKLQQPDQDVPEGTVTGEQRQRGRRVRMLRREPWAQGYAGGCGVRCADRRAQPFVAADGVDRVGLPGGSHGTEQELGGIVRGRRWRATAPWTRRYQAARNQHGYAKTQVATGLAEDLGQPLAELISF